MLDVFNQDVFSVVSLTDAINKPKFVPGRIGQLGLFQETAVATTTVVFEERNGILVLVNPTPRGGPGQTLDKFKRTARSLVVPHFEINDAVYADEVQNIRPFGQETGLETVQSVVADRLAIHSQSHASTIEYARVGAVKGVVTYADGTTLDSFSFFGVSQDSTYDFNLDASTDTGAIRKLCAQIIRKLSTNLDGIPFSGVYAICGDNFFDSLQANVEVRDSFLNNPAAAQLRQAYISNGMSYGAFDFGGITFENYRGAVGGTTFVDTDHVHMFPVGVPGLFRTYYAPADYVETVNTLGRPMYAKQFPMPNDKGVNLDSQMNCLNLCTRPKALLQGTTT